MKQWNIRWSSVTSIFNRQSRESVEEQQISRMLVQLGGGQAHGDR
jgi:hypothetical protein